MGKKKRKQKKSGYENTTSKLLLIPALIELLSTIAETIEKIVSKLLE